MSDSPPRAAPQAAPLVLSCAALGLLIALGRDRTALTAVLLWMEPFWLALGLYGVLALLWDRAYRAALGLTLGLILLVGGARAPLPGLGRQLEVPSWADALRGCALLPDPVRAPVRLLMWSVAPDRKPSLDAPLREAAPDIVLLTGTSDPTLAEALQRALGGEAITVDGATPEMSMVLAVRGAFQYCGGEDDHWVEDQPGPGGGSRVMLTFPEVADVGVIPLIAVRYPGPGGVTGWLDWPERLGHTSASVAGLVDTLGPRRAIVAGDLHSPRTFRALGDALRGAGLLGLPAPPNWPASLPGGLPGLSLHALDQVWAGTTWTAAGSRALEARGEARAPVVVDLAPNRGVATR